MLKVLRTQMRQACQVSKIVSKKRTLNFMTSQMPPLIQTVTRVKSFTTTTESNGHLIGVGGTKLGKTNPQQYAKIVETALKNGVLTFESVNGGEESLAQAYTLAMMQICSSDFCPKEQDVTVTARFGYRTEAEGGKSFMNDVPLLNDIGASSPNMTQKAAKVDRAFHNISSEYVFDCIEKNPLVKLKRGEWGQNEKTKNTNFIFMAHNPEAQGTEMFGSEGAQPPLDEIRSYVRERLVDSFKALEEACSNGSISSYGVCSNGLSLPASHPLHLDWKDVIAAASDASNAIHGKPTPPKLSTLQLPSNLLETNGLKVTKDIKSFFSPSNKDNNSGLSPIDVYISRPLTCYPDQGTGTGFPFKLVDYKIPLGLTPTEDSTTIWTHKITGDSPPQYLPALKLALQHFDAEHLLEAEQERTLTSEEKETLEGCRLLQSMLNDLDRSLEHVRSFDAYEDELYSKVIPLIYETFDALDEDSAAVLQAFFVAHGSATRHSVARTTRNLLQEGGDGVPPYEINAEERLQDFALQWILKNKYISKVIVGCYEPNHVIDAVNASNSINRIS